MRQHRSATLQKYIFFQSQLKKCISSKLIHTIKGICSFALGWVVSWHKARNVTKDWKIVLGFKCLLTAQMHVITVKKDLRNQFECPSDLYNCSKSAQMEVQHHTKVFFTVLNDSLHIKGKFFPLENVFALLLVPCTVLTLFSFSVAPADITWIKVIKWSQWSIIVTRKT